MSRSTAPEALAPHAVLRLAFPVGSNLYVTRDPATGILGGLSVDLGGEFASRLGIPLEQRPYNSIGELIAATARDQWDLATVIIDPARREVFDYTEAYLEADATYLVRAGSSIYSVTDADNPNIRIGVSNKSAFDLFLTQCLKNATLVRYTNVAAAIQAISADEVDAVAAPRQLLIAAQLNLPGMQVLDDWFDLMHVGMAVPKGRGKIVVPYLNRCLAELAASGWISDAIARMGMAGVKVAPGLSWAHDRLSSESSELVGGRRARDRSCV
jgi:polar amino acid transport system substrate-binding protein